MLGNIQSGSLPQDVTITVCTSLPKTTYIRDYQSTQQHSTRTEHQCCYKNIHPHIKVLSVGPLSTMTWPRFKPGVTIWTNLLSRLFIILSALLSECVPYSCPNGWLSHSSLQCLSVHTPQQDPAAPLPLAIILLATSQTMGLSATVRIHYKDDLCCSPQLTKVCLQVPGVFIILSSCSLHVSPLCVHLVDSLNVSKLVLYGSSSYFTWQHHIHFTWTDTMSCFPVTDICTVSDTILRFIIYL